MGRKGVLGQPPSKGVKDVSLIAGVAVNYGVVVTNIYHSTKKRAEETAKIIAEQLGNLPTVVRREGLKPLDDVKMLAVDLPNDNNMYVGHLPFMEKLVSRLVIGTTENRIIKFQNGGIICLDQDKAEGWYIKWTLMPNIS